MISFDNGCNWLDVDEISELSLVENWDVIENMMDDEIREEVHEQGLFSKREFLKKYLEIAGTLII